MSFLTLDADVDGLKKTIISIWFRVPEESVAGARALAKESSWQVLHGVIPFITWGKQQTAKVKLAVPVYQGAVTVGGLPITIQSYQPLFDAVMSPSFIGLYVGTTDQPQDPPVLATWIQTKDFATGSGVHFLVTGWTGEDSGLVFNDLSNPSNPYNGAPIYVHVTYQTTDTTDDRFGWSPDYFGGRSAGQDALTGKPKALAFDSWHHLLISWDLDARKMWCALDDENLTGINLPALNELGTMGPNDHKSNLEFSSWGHEEEGEIVHLNVTALPTNPVNVPGPGTVKYTKPEGGDLSKEPVLRVEMAELQLWTGVTLNTGVISNRRAFVDKDGKPVPPDQQETTDDDGNIITEKGSIELLGRPAILLHGSNNWIDGYNAGRIGVDADGNVIPAGQFKRVAGIEPYKPDPSLEKTTP